jgi:hypothetical protein
MIKKFAEAFKPLHESVQPVNEAKVDITIPANDAYDMEEEADNFKNILKKAGVDAKCKAAIGEVEIYLKDKGDLKKAQKAIEKAGYQYNADLWFSDAKYFKKSHKIYNLKPKDLISIGDETMTYADALKKFESTETLTEAKVELDSANFEDKAFQSYLKKNGIKAKLVDPAGPAGYAPVYKYSADKNTLKKLIDMFWAVDAQDAEEREDWYKLIESKGFASKELIKATDKLHSEQLKLQDLQSKFVTETDPAKKEKLKKQVIDQNKIVKQVERDFQTTLGREEEDIDDMFEATKIGGVTHWLPLSMSLDDLNDKLTADDIDDIITEIEVALDNINDPSPSTRSIVKKTREVVNNFSKLIVSLNLAIAERDK